jgi:hypothetical protein
MLLTCPNEFVQAGLPDCVIQVFIAAVDPGEHLEEWYKF